MLLGGRYKLLSAPLSTGSFGSVFMADDERMPRRVAVKVLHPQHAENPTVRARFRRELEAACRVSHENVVAVFDIGEDPNLGLYYVMELVKGTPLKDYLNGDPLPWAFVFRVATQLTRALHAIHSAGIVHRDLKPQNIMMVERSSLDELVKVLDFGIASLKSPEEEKRDVELTGARIVLGTPPYMSPEQTYMRSDRERLGVEVDARSDIYSMGIILYEMAAGRRPFSGDAHEIVVAHRLTKPMPLERMVGVAVPREFADLVMRALSKDPRERPQSAKEFLAAIKESELKPVRHWGEIIAAQQAADPHDMPTLGDALAIPHEAVPVDTQPRLVLDKARSRSLWAPIAALVVGAVAAVVAFIVSRPTVPEQLGAEARLESTRAGEGAAGKSGSANPSQGVEREAASLGAGLGAARVADKGVEAPKAIPDASVLADPGAGQVEAKTVLPALDRAGAMVPAVPAKADAAEVRPLAISKVAFMVTSQPSGAEVLVNGKVEGMTPLNLSFDTGDKRQVELVLKKDRYEDLPVVLSLGPELGGQALNVNHVLTRKKGVGGRDPFKDL